MFGFLKHFHGFRWSFAQIPAKLYDHVYFRVSGDAILSVFQADACY